MKCPKCRYDMQRKGADNIYYYECPNCQNTIGKIKEVDNAADETESSEGREAT